MKLARSSNILGAIRALQAGRTLIDQALAERASSIIRSRAEALNPQPAEQDREIIDRVLAGQTDREIADHLTLDLAVTQQSVTALIDRLMSPAREAADVDGTLTGGKHRRIV